MRVGPVVRSGTPLTRINNCSSSIFMRPMYRRHHTDEPSDEGLSDGRTKVKGCERRCRSTEPTPTFPRSSFILDQDNVAGSMLPPHRDREQCEHSMSILVDHSPQPDDVSPWTLCLQQPHVTTAVPI